MIEVVGIRIRISGMIGMIECEKGGSSRTNAIRFSQVCGPLTGPH